MEERLLNLLKPLRRKASKAGMPRRKRHLDMVRDSTFGRNMGKLMKFRTEYLRVFILKVR